MPPHHYASSAKTPGFADGRYAAAWQKMIARLSRQGDLRRAYAKRIKYFTDYFAKDERKVSWLNERAHGAKSVHRTSVRPYLRNFDV